MQNEKCKMPIAKCRIPEFCTLHSAICIDAPLPFSSAQPPEAQPQGIEADKSLGVALVVDLIRLEGRHVRIVERKIGFSPRDDHVALVGLGWHPAGDVV